jgi:2-keto-4-pentenoate hydratase/2-oxohepta-3-ene-1,7-dioic acid hydratase in catechol pathway
MLDRRAAIRFWLGTLCAGLGVVAMVGESASARQASASGTFRLLTFEVGNSGPRLGTTRGDGEQEIVDVHNAIRVLLASGAPEAQGIPPVPIDMRSLIEAGSESIAATRNIHDAITALRASGKFEEPGGTGRVFHPPAGVHYLPPVPNPSKMLGLAGNYIRRTADGKPGAHDAAEYPSAFFKPPSGLIGHGDAINLAGLLTTGVHEPEMSVVIGKKAKNVSEQDAMEYVMGYTIMNDVSSRDLRQGTHNSQGSSVSKGLDTFAPLGPFLTLPEDVPDPHNLAISARINGTPWDIPNANTKHLTFNVPQIIAYFSERMTLLPGDVIATGVPAPVVTLKAGDTVEITIERLGTLRNRVVSEPAGPVFRARKAPTGTGR